MDFYQVLEKRRTIRDFSDKKVTDEVLEKVLSAAFKAPTNDHLRQFEFIVVRGQENIARLISPVAENTRNIQQAGLDAAADMMDKDEHAMFVDALPKQQRMLMQSNCLVLPFFRQKDFPLCQPADQSSLNSLQRGRLWKIFCWQRRRKDWPARFVYRSVMSRNMSSGWSALLTDMSSPVSSLSAMQRRMHIFVSRKKSG